MADSSRKSLLLAMTLASMLGVGTVPARRGDDPHDEDEDDDEPPFPKEGTPYVPPGIPRQGRRRWCNRCRGSGDIGNGRPCPDCGGTGNDTRRRRR